MTTTKTTVPIRCKIGVLNHYSDVMNELRCYGDDGAGLSYECCRDEVRKEFEEALESVWPNTRVTLHVSPEVAAYIDGIDEEDRREAEDRKRPW